MRAPPSTLGLYASLPFKERWFVRARWFSAPLEAVVKRAPDGEVIEVGCGHGLLTAMLADGHSKRRVLGIDPDGHKIRWAKQALAPLGNVTLEQTTLEKLLPEWKGKADAVVICDVLYLLPLAVWAEVFAQVRELLKPGGVFLWKEAEDDHGWKARKCLLQEQVMVNVIGKTHGSGGLHLETREKTVEMLRAAGFSNTTVVDLARGFTTPHVLFVAKP